MMVMVRPRHSGADDRIASRSVDSPVQADTRVMPVRRGVRHRLRLVSMVVVMSQERVRMTDRRGRTGLMSDTMRGSRRRVRQTVSTMLLEEVRILIRQVVLVRRVIRRRVRAVVQHMVTAV